MKSLTPTQELVLDCYHSPHLLTMLADQSIPLPEGIERLLRAALASAGGAPHADARELQAATLVFVKNVVLVPGGDHYRALGLRFDATPEQIDTHYRLLLALLQFDSQASTAELARHVARITRAHSVLGTAARRRVYDKCRYGALIPDEAPELPIDAIVQSIVGGSGVTRQAAATAARALQAEDGAGAAANVELTPPSANGIDGGAGVEPAVSAVPPALPISNRTLAVTSLAALLVILAVSPVIATRVPLFWPPAAQAPGDSLVAGTFKGEALPLVPVVETSAAVQASFAVEPELPLIAVVEEPSTLSPAPEPPPMLASKPQAAAPASANAVPPARPTAPAVAKRAADTTAAAAVLTAPLLSPTQLSAAEPAAPSVAIADPVLPMALETTPRLLDNSDLDRVVAQLAEAYQRGDVEQFLGLFAENARSNDQFDRTGIGQDYRALFESTERRQFLVDDVRWNVIDQRAVGEGTFTARIKPKWQSRDQVVSGRIKLELEKRPLGILITGMYHEYQ